MGGLGFSVFRFFGFGASGEPGLGGGTTKAAAHTMIMDKVTHILRCVTSAIGDDSSLVRIV